MNVLVTGGAGLIGANFVLDWIANDDEPVINLDKLTYAGTCPTLDTLQGNPRHIFTQGDIGVTALLERLLAEHQARAIVNFAAKSHVDRSIHGPEASKRGRHKPGVAPWAQAVVLCEPGSLSIAADAPSTASHPMPALYRSPDF